MVTAWLNNWKLPLCRKTAPNIMITRYLKNGKADLNPSKNDLIRGLYKYTKNGGINSELFDQWLRYFQMYAKPSVHEHVILVLDNHSNHFHIGAFNFYKGYNIHMFPSLTSNASGNNKFRFTEKRLIRKYEPYLPT